MIGFLIGTVCLAGLFATLRAERYARLGMAYGGGCGGARACGGPAARWGWYQRDAYGDSPRGWHRRWREEQEDREPRSARDSLRRLFEELDTTPGQEKAILAAFKALEEAVTSAREGWSKTSNDLAQVFRKESFDETMLGEAVARLDGAQDTLRKEVVKVVGDIHAALDDKQRGKLADLMERGHVDFLWRMAGIRRGEV
ncbi:MAG: hypothetical protein U0165_04935 [Polyangiaceae bacterium]